MKSFTHTMPALAGAWIALAAAASAQLPRSLEAQTPLQLSPRNVAAAAESSRTDSAPEAQPLNADQDVAPPYALERIDVAALRSLERSLEPERDGSGALWVRGRSYKARFDARSATYVPYFGPAAPRNYPVTFTVASARIGDVALDVTPTGEARAVVGGVEMPRAAFVERYELRQDSIEQTFVLGARAADGDLSIEIDVESELELGEDADGALALRGEHGAVLYGRASVVDARGVRTDVTTRRGQGRIMIDVADGVLDGSVFPLVVDPIVSTFSIDASNYDDFAPDVAYDASNDRWLVVMEETFSEWDHDVYGYLLDGSGVAITGAWADATTEDWRRPAVANLNAADLFLLVVEANNVGGSAISQIRARRALAVPDAAGLFGTLAFTVSGPTTSACQQPDVGGDSYPTAPSYFCVTWNRAITLANQDVQYRLVDSAGMPVGGGPTTVESSLENDTQTAISAGAGDAVGPDQRFTIVWRRESTYDQVRAAQVAWNGGLIGTHLVHASTFARPGDLTKPSVSTITTGPGTAQLYLVAFEYAAGAPEGDVQYVLFDGATQASDVHTEYAFSGLEYTAPQIEWDGVTFTLAYVRAPAATPNQTRVSVQTLGLVSNAGFLTTFPYKFYSGYYPETPGTSTTELRPKIFAKPSAAGTQRRTLIVWDEQSGSGSHRNVVGALRDHHPSGFPLTFCWGTAAACPCGDGPHVPESDEIVTGCANSVSAEGAKLLPSGTFQVSADNAWLQAQQVPASAACLFLQGTATVGNGLGALFGDGLRCVGGSIIRLGTETASGGVATYGDSGDIPISVRGMLPASGGTRLYQVWYRNSASFCTASTFNLTNGIMLVWFP